MYLTYFYVNLTLEEKSIDFYIATDLNQIAHRFEICTVI